MKRSLAMTAALALCCTLVPPERAVLAQPRTRATVTIAGVHYALPLSSDAKDRELAPRNPLCYLYQYLHIATVGRELYVNGDLRYRAKVGDEVVVLYPQGVRVNGAPPQAQPEKSLRKSPCHWSDFPP